MSNKEEYPIDVVVTWVDNTDPLWIEEKDKYVSVLESQNPHVGGDNRYQDQGLLKYWFRCIEKNMPWINKVYFVTFGHVPSWLNVDCPKIKVVKHSDFISKEYLPTFNSNAILLNLHRIPGLQERFIYFNDDMFVLKPCKPSMFFKRGLPRDMSVMNPIAAPDTDPFWDMMLNNIMIINKNFKKKNSIKHNFLKYYSPYYSFKNIMRNIGLCGYNYFPGFYDNHLPNAYLKSTFEEVWNKNEMICKNTCKHKVRHHEDITEWTMKYWQFAKGSFYPINKEKLGEYKTLNNESTISQLLKYKKRLVCLNDESDNIKPYVDFFDNLFLTKSSFEK